MRETTWERPTAAVTPSFDQRREPGRADRLGREAALSGLSLHIPILSDWTVLIKSKRRILIA
jgi:hypothetical protein